MTKQDTYRETCTVLSIASILGYFFLNPSPILLAIAVIVGISGLFIPLFRKYIHIAWMGIGKVLGWFVSKIVLSVVYFVFLTPIAFLSRMFSTNNIRTIPNDSNWKTRKHTYNKEELKKLW